MLRRVSVSQLVLALLATPSASDTGTVQDLSFSSLALPAHGAASLVSGE